MGNFSCAMHKLKTPKQQEMKIRRLEMVTFSTPNHNGSCPF